MLVLLHTVSKYLEFGVGNTRYHIFIFMKLFTWLILEVKKYCKYTITHIFQLKY